MSSPDDSDLTAQSGGPTDVAPLGRSGPKPDHEKTAAEDGDPVDWNKIAEDPAFKALLAAKRRFLTIGTIFFMAYYLALPILVGFWPDVMRQPVIGKVNWAYLFALSQFFMAWILAAIYRSTAARWDRMNEELLARLNHR